MNRSNALLRSAPSRPSRCRAACSWPCPACPWAEVVQHVGRLVHPAPLLARLPEHLPQRRPEAQRPVADRQLRKPPASPRAFRSSSSSRHDCSLSRTPSCTATAPSCPRRGSHHDQDALAGLRLQPHVEVDAIHPEVHVPLVRQRPLAPGLVVPLPDLLEPNHRRADNPGASGPSRAVKASLKSPVLMPLRYSQGISSSMLFVRRRVRRQDRRLIISSIFQRLAQYVVLAGRYDMRSRLISVMLAWVMLLGPSNVVAVHSQTLEAG
jgi:hypothetical protein